MAIKTIILVNVDRMWLRYIVIIVHYHGMMMPWSYQPVCNTTRQTMELRVIFKTQVNIVNIWKSFSFTKRLKISMSSAVNYGSGKKTLIGCWPYKEDDPIYLYIGIGRIHLSVSTVNRTYEFSGGTQMIHFCRYGKHSIGSSTYGLWVRTNSMLSSTEPILVVSSYKGPSNAMCTYGTLARIRKYRLQSNMTMYTYVLCDHVPLVSKWIHCWFVVVAHGRMTSKFLMLTASSCID